MSAADQTLERWRLILGEAGQDCLDGRPLDAAAAGRDAALDWLYGRDEDLARRGIRPRTGRAAREPDRTGGSDPPILTTVDWIEAVHRLFPKETVERLERDAVERYQITDLVTNPAVLERIEPNRALLDAVLRTRHLMDPEVLRLARRIVDAVVRELMAKLATEIRQAFSGSRVRRPSRYKQARNFDVGRTIRANLAHYRPDERRLYIERPYFRSRSRRHLDRWQVIVLVDQSRSMLGSVIHSAVTAACLCGLPGVRTHLVAFDTSVVDLTSDVDDPVELLMKVQLGGGTDIASAVGYGAQLIEQPRRAIMVLVTDFFEGGDEDLLVHTARQLVGQGTVVLGLAALDEDANPQYDRDLAQRLANEGVHVGAMTPGQLATFIAERIGR